MIFIFNCIINLFSLYVSITFVYIRTSALLVSLNHFMLRFPQQTVIEDIFFHNSSTNMWT